jgi:hypothetical protein
VPAFQRHQEGRLLAAPLFAQRVAGEDRRQHSALQHVEHDDGPDRAAQRQPGQRRIAAGGGLVIDQVGDEQAASMGSSSR